MAAQPLATPAYAHAQALPVADWIDPAELRRDPYPAYARLRAESPVVWAPRVRKVLIASYSGCVHAEQHPEIFSSAVSSAHMVRAFGKQPMIRKDDPEHASERAAFNTTLRPKMIQEVWSAMFEANTRHYLDQLAGVGPLAADLNTDFAAPLAAKNLVDLLGMRETDPLDLARWSVDFIAGCGNVTEDESIWARCADSRQQTNDRLDVLLPYLQRHPDHSMTSMLLQSGMPEESVRANVMLTISGGMNEPQHMITNIAYLLEQSPAILARAQAEPALWPSIFSEAARFYSPIGMVTRESVIDSVIDDVLIPAHSQVGILLASANRDPALASDPDRFDPDRSNRRHLAFGNGPHICAGKWAAEASIGRIAIPALYARFAGLRLDPSRPLAWDGWAFRGLTSLPVTWN